MSDLHGPGVTPAMVVTKLNKYADLQADSRDLNVRYQGQIDTIMAPVQERLNAIMAEVQPQIDAINAQRAGLMAEYENEMEQLAAEIKANVIGLGETVKGMRVMAVYSKPRVSWDTKGLDGFLAAHPEMERFRTVGEPSVSFRAVNGK